MDQPATPEQAAAAASEPAQDAATGTATEPPALAPLKVDTARIVLVGTALWLVALVVTLVVPALHRGDHSWWPWAALSGALLGALGVVYVRRGRGNASAAQ